MSLLGCYCQVTGGACPTPATCRSVGLRPARPPAPEPEPPPRVQGYVLGFRMWTLDGYRLLSANTSIGAHWSIGENKAQCLAHKLYMIYGYEGEPRGHEAPHPNCACGLYAYHYAATLEAFNARHEVCGAVQAWGRIEVHHLGFRAQYARPVLLAYSERQPYGDVVKVKAIGGEMDIPVVPIEELAQAGKAFGEPVAQELRPAALGGLTISYTPPHITIGFSGSMAAPMQLTPPPPSPPPPRRKPWKLGAALNGFAAALNYSLFAFGPRHAAVTLACALASTAIAAFFVRRGIKASRN